MGEFPDSCLQLTRYIPTRTHTHVVRVDWQLDINESNDYISSTTDSRYDSRWAGDPRRQLPTCRRSVASQNSTMNRRLTASERGSSLVKSESKCSVHVQKKLSVVSVACLCDNPNRNPKTTIQRQKSAVFNEQVHNTCIINAMFSITSGIATSRLAACSSSLSRVYFPTWSES